jgi:hypothetical protein
MRELDKSVRDRQRDDERQRHMYCGPEAALPWVGGDDDVPPGPELRPDRGQTSSPDPAMIAGTFDGRLSPYLMGGDIGRRLVKSVVHCAAKVRARPGYSASPGRGDSRASGD